MLVDEADQVPDAEVRLRDGEPVLFFRRGFLTREEFLALAVALAPEKNREVLQRLA